MAEDGCNRDDGVSLQLYTAYDSFDPDIRYALETIKVIACHSACNIDPLNRGIGVQN
jgi:hypothetical protein